MPKKSLEVASLAAKPGERVFDLLTLHIADQDVQIPLFLINGAEEGPTLAVTAGIHGAEYAGIEAALRFARLVDPTSLQGQVIVAPMANPPAFWARSIYVCPLDGKNLNRVFPGDPQGSPSEILAHWLFQNLISRGDYYIDLHGGDMIEALVPFVIYRLSGDDKVDKASDALARSYGFRYLVESKTKGAATSAAAARGIPSMLAESGGQGIWDEVVVGAHTTGLLRALRHLGMVEGGQPEEVPTQLLRTFAWLRSEHNGFYYPKTKVGDVVAKGRDLGYIGDHLNNVLQTLEAPLSGRILFLVTSLAINQGDPLLAVGA